MLKFKQHLASIFDDGALYFETAPKVEIDVIVVKFL